MGNKRYEQDRNLNDELRPWKPDLSFDIEKKLKRRRNLKEERNRLEIFFFFFWVSFKKLESKRNWLEFFIFWVSFKKLESMRLEMLVC